MITNNEIQYFFETYFSNFITSISLVDKLLEPTSSKDEWIGLVKKYARSQQSLCMENDYLIDDFLVIIRKDKERLDSAQFDLVLKYCRKLYYSNYNEPTMLLKCVNVLIPHYQKLNDIDSLMFLYTCGGYSSMQLSRTGDREIGKQSVSYYKKVIAHREEIETFQLPVSRDYIFIAYDNLIRVEPCLHNLSMDEAYELWQELSALRTQEKFCQYDESNPRIPLLCSKTLLRFISSECFSEAEGFTISVPLRKILTQMTIAEYKKQFAQTASIYDCAAPVVFNYHKYLVTLGVLSCNEAWKILDDYYFKKCETIYKDDELDELSFYVDLTICLITMLEKTTFSKKRKKEKYLQYRNHMMAFLTQQQSQTDLYSLSDGLCFSTLHPCVLRTFDNEVERINFIIDMVVSSHLSTLTHSVMVSYLAEAILKRVFEYCPDLLMPADGSYTRERILSLKNLITDYAIQACLLHDIGKNGIIPVINTQHRRLSDYEFSLIRMHPKKGAAYLSSSPDFVIFEDIALGHHKSYDGKKGYPADFDNVHSKYHIIIDLIHICDCLDAATDYLSRNYHRAKSFETVMQELVNEKGTDYNPDFIDLILGHPDLYEELRLLTEQNRENIYYDVYLTFVNKRK